MGDITLFDKAVTNFNSAVLLRKSIDTDESQLNIIAFHLQQSLEFALKYQFEMNGIEYPKVHTIEQLIRFGKDNDVDLRLTEYIEEHAEMFSQWEAKSRYILGYLIEQKKIDKAIEEIKLYLSAIHESEEKT